MRWAGWATSRSAAAAAATNVAARHAKIDPVGAAAAIKLAGALRARRACRGHECRAHRRARLELHGVVSPLS
jgi:hypothetical protein